MGDYAIVSNLEQINSNEGLKMAKMGRGVGLRRPGQDDDVTPLKITDRRMLLWFYRRLIPHTPKVLLGLSGMLIGTIAGLYAPMILKKIFDQVIEEGRLEVLPGLIWLFASFTFASIVFGAVRTNVMHLLGQRFVYDVRMQCYRHIMKLGLNFFESQRSGDLMSRISNDVDSVEHMVVHGTDDIITSVIHVFGATFFLFYMDWQLAVLALAPLPIYVISLFLFAKYVRPVFGQIRKELGEINTKLQERIGGVRVIKSFAQESAEIEFFDESSRAYWKARSKSIWMWSSFFPYLRMLTSVGLILVLWQGASRSAAGQVAAVSSGTVVAFLAYIQNFYQPINALSYVQNTLNRALASLARIFELLDYEPSVKDKEDAIELGHIEGRVDIEDVTFKYDTGETILEHISVSARPGEVVAIVGRSGAGKTSLVNLIPRFYDPVKGRVLIDGHDVRDVTQESLRRNIGMVLQETFLFNDTVRANIRYAKPDATEEQIVAAAKWAYADQFIKNLPEGYDTVIGERGVKLSGGEKQRVSIARAFLADPKILILDEATSMVDTEAEQNIQKALTELMRGRTTFIIAHRLSTVRSADKIVVIDDGRIIEQDKHDNLMSKNGLYKEMVTRQYTINLDLENEITDDMMR